jgi:D-alanyl-D-alanine carboxypeptidase
VPTITGRCAIVWEPRTDSVLYQKNPDRSCWTGSTAKIMTLHGLLWAIKRGHLELDDTYAYSEKSAAQGCTCIGSYLKDKPEDVKPQEVAKVGERTTVRDMVYGIAMSAAQPTVSAAELVAQVLFHDTTEPPSTSDESSELEVEFVRDVMRPHAAHAGATKTAFVNEHGGHLSVDDDALPGSSKGSARDFVRMWDHGSTESPLFLQALNLDSYEHVNHIPSISSVHAYRFSKGYSYYPGIEGDKNGGVTPEGEPTWSSIVAGSLRLGRRLVVDVMEADGDKNTEDDAASDAAKALAYSFAKIFTPVEQAATSLKGSISDHALDCLGATRCVGVTSSGDELRADVWAVPTDRKKIERLGSGAAETAAELVTEVDVAYLGSSGSGKEALTGRFVTAARSAGAIELRGWKIPPGPSRAPLPGATAALYGSEVELLRLGPTRFIVAVISPNGYLRLSAWALGRGGSLSKLYELSTGRAEEIALAASDRPMGFVTFVRRVKTRLTAWAVASSGAISKHSSSKAFGSVDLGPKAHLSVARLATGVYATAGMDQNRGLLVSYFQLQGLNDEIKRLAVMGPFPGDVTETQLVGLSKDAVLIGARDAGKLRLIPMEWDKRFDDWKGNHDYFKLGVATGSASSGFDLAQLGTGAAVADIIVGAKASGKLELTAWRLGAKP